MSECRIILKDDYESYESALDELKLDRLDDRRVQLSLEFAKKCTQHDKLKYMFPLNEKDVTLRKHEKYSVKFTRTARLYNSAIPSLTRLLNENE